MEVTQPPVGFRTRPRAMAVVTEETADSSGHVKRRKLGNEELIRSPSSTFLQTKSTVDREIHVCSVLKENRNDSCDAAASHRSGEVPASCCSSTGSIKTLKVSDLEEISVEVESAAKQVNGMNNSSGTVLRPAGKTPPEAELEEFFAAAQEGLTERFKNKYNFDIANDTPMKGRFEWIQVKSGK